MNTLTNAYEKKLSSGIITALLVISAFAFILPVVLPAHAATAQFSASLSYPYVTVGTAGAIRDISITNPKGNPAITEVDVNVPLAAAAPVTGADFVDGFINEALPAVAGSGPWTAVYAGSASGITILPQGAAGHIDLVFTSEAAESTTGVVDGYGLTVQVTYSTGVTQTVVLTLYEGSAAISTTALNTATPALAGSSSTFTTTLDTADKGVPLTFSCAVAGCVSAAFASSFTPSSGVTGASGTLSTSLLATEATTYNVQSDAGTAYGSDSAGMLTVVASGVLTLNPAAPTQVSITSPLDVPGVTPTYISTQVAQALTIGLADKYGNLVPHVTGTAMITAIAGTISHKSLLFTAGATNMSITYAPISPSTTNLLKFGSFDLITASLVVTAGAPTGTYTGSSTQLDIGYVSTTNVAGLFPAVHVYTPSAVVQAPYYPAAGTLVGLSLTLADVQQNVPVNFTLTSTSTTVPYTGTFSNGLSWTIAYTNANGVAAANFTADSVALDAATAQAFASEPTTSAPTATLGTGLTGVITTEPNVPASLKVVTCLDSLCVTPTSYTTPSSKLYIDVLLEDAYGNGVDSPFTFALQVSLTTSAGGLSSTTVYVKTGSFDTIGSGYVVQYTAPTALGQVTLGAATTQPGITGISATLTVVSPDPRVFVTSGLTVNSTSTAIAGYAMPSLAASPTTFITQFTYSLNGAASVTVPITGTNSSSAAFFSFIAPLMTGTNTVTISATDSSGNVGTVTESITVYTGPAVVGQTFVVPSGQSPKLVTVSGFTGVNATFMNTGTRTFSGQVWFELLNSNNQVVQGPTFVQSSFTAGNTQTFFFALSPGLASGSYTAKLFVVVAGQAYSASYTAPVTVS